MLCQHGRHAPEHAPTIPVPCCCSLSCFGKLETLLTPSLTPSALFIAIISLTRAAYHVARHGRHGWLTEHTAVTKPTNYMKLSKKISTGADNLVNLSPHNPIVCEITKDFKPTNIQTKIVQVY
jgi:hypothetical protein